MKDEFLEDLENANKLLNKNRNLSKPKTSHFNVSRPVSLAEELRSGFPNLGCCPQSDADKEIRQKQYLSNLIDEAVKDLPLSIRQEVADLAKQKQGL